MFCSRPVLESHPNCLHRHLILYCGPQFATEFKEENFKLIPCRAKYNTQNHRKTRRKLYKLIPCRAKYNTQNHRKIRRKLYKLIPCRAKYNTQNHRKIRRKLIHIHKIFYIKTFKITPTRFDPKIVFRELHCSFLKPHFYKHSLITFLILTWCCGSISNCVSRTLYVFKLFKQFLCFIFCFNFIKIVALKRAPLIVLHLPL